MQRSGESVENITILSKILRYIAIFLNIAINHKKLILFSTIR